MTDLLIDIGNTALKAQPPGSSETLYCPASDNGQLDLGALQSIAKPNRILIACVSQSNRLGQVTNFCQQQWPTTPIWRAQTTESATGVQCAYEEPSRLGIDRWLAVLAAADQPTIVADAGTALTVDWVQPGQHLGGWIVAGLELQSSTLLSKATNIRTVSPNTNVKASTPKDTAKAIADGSLAALLGVLEQAKTNSLFEQQMPRLWLTGGDAQSLKDAGASGWQLQHGLVFRGLEILASCHPPEKASCWLSM